MNKNAVAEFFSFIEKSGVIQEDAIFNSPNKEGSNEPRLIEEFKDQFLFNDDEMAMLKLFMKIQISRLVPFRHNQIRTSALDIFRWFFNDNHFINNKKNPYDFKTTITAFSL